MSSLRDRRSFRIDEATLTGDPLSVRRLPEVVIGRIVALDEGGRPTVEYPGIAAGEPVAALTTAACDADAVGREAALLFVDGDPARPLVVGLLQRPAADVAAAAPARVTLTARDDLVLSCGKASITLTRAGKVLIRGAYLLSRSSGVNRIKGGSVQIN